MNPFVQFVKDISGRIGNGFSSLNHQDPSNLAYLRNLEREMKSKNVLDIPFEELNITVFDLETTGFYPYKGDRILSIGAVKVEGMKIQDQKNFYSVVHIDASPSQEITKLTGITKEMVQDAPILRDVLKDFFGYVKNDLLVAHHANHEKQFMNHATWFTLKKKFQHRIVDTTFLTKVLEGEDQLITLDECCNHFRINNEQRHHALYDARATAELWVACVREIQQQGFTDLKDVYTKLATLK